MRKKDESKREYIERVLYDYKRNKSRLKILNMNELTDDDYTIGAIDYSKDKIQTSNSSDLSDFAVRREREKVDIETDIITAAAILESLNEFDFAIINGLYVENLKQREILEAINRFDVCTVHRNKERILKQLEDLVL